MSAVPEDLARRGRELEDVSDAIDDGNAVCSYDLGCSLMPPFPVNVLKGKLWNEKSEFDEEKDKDGFRDYESACDRVKDFYRMQHST